MGEKNHIADSKQQLKTKFRSDRPSSLWIESTWSNLHITRKNKKSQCSMKDTNEIQTTIILPDGKYIVIHHSQASYAQYSAIANEVIFSGVVKSIPHVLALASL